MQTNDTYVRLPVVATYGPSSDNPLEWVGGQEWFVRFEPDGLMSLGLGTETVLVYGLWETCNDCGKPGRHGDGSMNYELGLCQGCYDELLDAPLPSDEFGHYVHPAYALDTPSERATYYQGGF